MHNIMLPVALGIVHKPAAKGFKPVINCRNWPVNKNMPAQLNKATSNASSAVLKLALVKRPKSISGCGKCCCRLQNITAVTIPATIKDKGINARLFCAACFTPNMAASTAAINNAALVRSSLPALESLNSGSRAGAVNNKSNIIGIATRKTDPHQKWLSSNPPNTGPSMVPEEKQVV